MSTKIVFSLKEKQISFKDLEIMVKTYKPIILPTLPSELVDLIIGFAKDGKTYKSWLETCKAINKCHKRNYLKYCNQLWTLITRYPKKPWNWCSISSNPNITTEIIEKYPDREWNWGSISRNPNITVEFIEKHPEKPWTWAWVSRNPSITMEIIEKYPEKRWDWNFISENPNITMEFIEKYPNKRWDWDCISVNVFKKSVNTV